MLDGGAGIDIMIGCAATIIMSSTMRPTRSPKLAAGTDTSDSVTFTLGANVENLTLTGVGNINGTGNTLNNITRPANCRQRHIILATAAPAPNDIMNGGLGNDTYTVDNARR